MQYTTTQEPTGEICFFCKQERYPDDGEYVIVLYRSTYVSSCDEGCKDRVLEQRAS